MSHTTTAVQEVQRYIRGLEYPCTKQDLLVAAVHAGAPADILHRLNALQVDAFSHPVEVSDQLVRYDAAGGR